MDPVHLRPTAPLAPRVLLPGDPGRALLLAQAVLEAPKMFNHHRGLWGYTGRAADGEPMTVQASGMGGPSAAVVVEELVALGARQIVRVGTCGALEDHLRLGDLVVAGEAIAADGTSAALGAEAGEKVLADPELSARLGGLAGTAAGVVASTDLFYARDAAHEAELRARWRSAGARAVEMEAATVFALARLRGIRAGALLLVTDELHDPAGRARMEDAALEEAAGRLGAIAAGALAPG